MRGGCIHRGGRDGQHRSRRGERCGRWMRDLGWEVHGRCGWYHCRHWRRHVRAGLPMHSRQGHVWQCAFIMCKMRTRQT